MKNKISQKHPPVKIWNFIENIPDKANFLQLQSVLIAEQQKGMITQLPQSTKTLHPSKSDWRPKLSHSFIGSPIQDAPLHTQLCRDILFILHHLHLSYITFWNHISNQTFISPPPLAPPLTYPGTKIESKNRKTGGGRNEAKNQTSSDTFWFWFLPSSKATATWWRCDNSRETPIGASQKLSRPFDEQVKAEDGSLRKKEICCSEGESIGLLSGIRRWNEVPNFTLMIWIMHLALRQTSHLSSLFNVKVFPLRNPVAQQGHTFLKSFTHYK